MSPWSPSPSWAHLLRTSPTPKSATNTFTVGNVKIDLIESKYHREGNDNSGDLSIPDPTHKVAADDGMKYVTDGPHRVHR